MGEPTQSTSDAKSSRDELDARATELGVENPQGLRSKEAVEGAIREAKAQPRFSREEVLANARALTGCSRSIMAGALHGDKRKSFTKADAKQLGEEFKRHKVERKKVSA